MLIIADRADPHAQAVAWAPAELGEPTHFLSSSQLPGAMGLSHDPAAGRSGWDGGPPAPAKVVWLRRIGRFGTDPAMDKEEADFVRAECDQHLSGLLLAMERSAVMANGYSATRDAAIKPFQLAAAARLGFATPRTLVTNDPAAAAAFWRESGGRLIYKAMTLPDFTDGEEPLILPTTRLEAHHLEDGALIAACPALLQHEIRRTAEIRVLVMGDDVAAMKYRPPGKRDSVDWRQSLHDGHCEPFELPAGLRDLCCALVRDLRLHYGCIDLAVDEEGDFVFFEINSAGQFLFMEESVPELDVLRRFVCFLLRLGGVERREAAPVSLANYHARAA